MGNPETEKGLGVPEQNPKSETHSTTSSSDLEKTQVPTEPAVERRSSDSVRGERKLETTALEEAKELDRPQDDDIEYPSGLKLGIITLALCLSVFLVALVCSSLLPSPASLVLTYLRIIQSLRRPFLVSRTNSRR